MEKEVKFTILKDVNDKGLSLLAPYGTENYYELVNLGFLELKKTEGEDKVFITSLGKEFLKEY